MLDESNDAVLHAAPGLTLEELLLMRVLPQFWGK